MNVRFVTLDPGHNMWEIALQKLPISIGRHPQAGIRLDDQAVSDFHCEIEDVLGDVCVLDVGSALGTFVNGAPVTKTILCSGDRLTVGMTTFCVAYTSETTCTPDDDAVRPWHLGKDLERAVNQGGAKPCQQSDC